MPTELTVLIAAVAILGIAAVARHAITAHVTAGKQQLENSAQQTAILADSLRLVAQLKGIHPHQAAPATFAPAGASWEAVRAARQAQEQAEITKNLRDQEAKLEELRDAKQHLLNQGLPVPGDWDAEAELIEQRLEADRRRVSGGE